MDFRLIDIRDTEALRDVITQTKPDIIHLAAAVTCLNKLYRYSINLQPQCDGHSEPI